MCPGRIETLHGNYMKSRIWRYCLTKFDKKIQHLLFHKLNNIFDRHLQGSCHVCPTARNANKTNGNITVVFGHEHTSNHPAPLRKEKNIDKTHRIWARARYAYIYIHVPPWSLHYGTDGRILRHPKNKVLFTPFATSRTPNRYTAVLSAWRSQGMSTYYLSMTR